VYVPLGKRDRVGTGLRGWQGIFSRNVSYVAKPKVLRGQHLRTLCLENELEKRKK